MTLTEFLLARIAEDEAAARAALVEAEYFQFGETAAEALLGLAESEGAQDVAVAHFARHDPARVLAECEAKRRIVDEHPKDDQGFCGDGIGLVGCKWLHPCPTLRHLATVYADHPDYRSEWKL